MNIFNKFKRAARTGLVLAAVSAAVVGTGLWLGRSTPVYAASSCDKVNVIYCGVGASTTAGEINNFKRDYDNNTSNHSPAYHDVQTIYNYVGASKTLVDGMNTSNTVVGAVHRNGNVTVGSKVVATNAWVAARFSVSGAKHIPGTNAYLRLTTSSFAQESEPALIREDSNGKMLFAAIIGCGNAVKATPKVVPPAPKPAYTINKEVAVKGSTAYAKSVSVKPGTHVVYRITVASTGNAPVTNLNVKDALPAHVQYVTGTLKRDNVAANASFFTTGVLVGTLKNGTSTVFTFEGIVGPSDTPQVCVTEKLPNTASMTATGLPGGNSTATVDKSCLPKPAYACTNLSATAVSRTKFNFTAKASATNGAVIKSYTYTFGDGTTNTVTTAAATSTTAHTYAAPGTFNSKVDVTFTVPGLSGPQTVTAPACATTVTVKPAPAAECTDLKLIQNTSNPRAVSATVTYTAVNGATLAGISYNWDDGTVTAPSLNTTANHTYQKDGTFNVVATLTFNGGVATSTCQAPITITTVMPTCDNLKIDVSNDDKTVTVSSFTFTANNGSYEATVLDWGDQSAFITASDIVGQSHTYTAKGPYTIKATPVFSVNGVDTPVTSAACQATVTFTETPTPPVTPPVVPPTLVNTGAGSTIGLFALASIAGTFAYRWFLGRRLNG